jgi:hypothetical protein
MAEMQTHWMCKLFFRLISHQPGLCGKSNHCRFEIEKGVIEGSIDVDDIPALWSAKMKEYLGVEVDNDAEGCLQDVHWSAGLFGYFPT